jgi:phage-related protein
LYRDLIRELIFYKNYFEDFFNPLPEKVKSKIDEILFMITILERVPSKYFKSIEGVKGLYEIRVEFESNIYRIFCCFDKGKVVVLFNGFQKKSQKTPMKELEKAEKLMKEYFNEQKNDSGNGSGK